MSRTRSETGSTSTRGYRFSSQNTNSTNDLYLSMSMNPGLEALSYVVCDKSLCTSSSGRGDWDSMSLRMGFSRCTKHMTPDIVEKKCAATNMPADLFPIFYDIEVNSTNEIEQVAAVMPLGGHFDVYIRTVLRTNNSPLLRTISPHVYILTAMEPRDAMIRLINWVRNTWLSNYGTTFREEHVLMIAHAGSKHDHVMILKTMMKWGLEPPQWRFSDTLPMYKTIICPDESAKLTELVNRYAVWFDHVPHDALSDAKALMYSTMNSNENWLALCYTFSCTYKDFINFVGLNVVRIRSPVPFPTTSLDSNDM